MKIFSSEQTKRWDAYTIKNERIPSIDLMEKAALKCVEFILKKFHDSKFIIFCGSGNNGGDGLAIARMLKIKNVDVETVLVSEKEGSPDYMENLKRIKTISDVCFFSEEKIPSLSGKIVIDAIFGNGLNRPVTGELAKVIKYINDNASRVISIDIPSGMFADKSSKGNSIIRADLTLTFERKKLAFFMPENGPFLKKIKILTIGLSADFEKNEKTVNHTLSTKDIKEIYKPRASFTNKGNYGYACLIAGSHGMMGAAVLSTHGALRSGAGKVACYTCGEGYQILQTAAPEALCTTFGKKYISGVKDIHDFNAIGIGPGIGKHASHTDLLSKIFEESSAPVVIDADALNMMSKHPGLYKKIPAQSILTPHPKEFERLFGKSADDFSQRARALQKAGELNVYIVLKGRYTYIATPEGKGYFNTTGNPGMATGGTGDVLTGIITGLLAQHYSPLQACQLGVYLHGLAGDIAAKAHSQEALIAEDVYHYLGKAFLKVNKLTGKN